MDPSATARSDVLIVGAGPAGAACAWRLTRAGARVTILDRAPFPRAKPCAGWVTPAAFDALALDPHLYARSALLQPISAFAVGLLGAPLRPTAFDATVGYGLRRSEFDHFLLRRSGARFELAPAGVEPCRDHRGWILNGRWHAPLLVGAGGHFCPVARLLGGRPAAEPAVLTRVAEFEMEPEEALACRAAPGCPELHFFPDLDGYAWCLRKGAWLNVGLGWLGGGGQPERLSAFVHALRRSGRLCAWRQPRFSGHAYLLRCQSPRQAGAPGVLLAGDAAGLAASASGEGIAPAIESGLLAAQAILDAALDPGRLRPEDYAAALERRFGPPAQAALPPALNRLRTLAARCALSGPGFLRRAVLERQFLHRCA